MLKKQPERVNKERKFNIKLVTCLQQGLNKDKKSERDINKDKRHAGRGKIMIVAGGRRGMWSSDQFMDPYKMIHAVL